ncbi:MAG: YraN family protein [Acidimicrobiia bacterium]
MGRYGELVAARFLTDHGLRVVAGNVDVGRGEVDLLAMDGGARVVVEVRTTTTGGDPIDAVGLVKRRRVRSLAGMAGASRVDLVGVGLRAEDVVIHWVPGCG